MPSCIPLFYYHKNSCCTLSWIPVAHVVAVDHDHHKSVAVIHIKPRLGFLEEDRPLSLSNFENTFRACNNDDAFDLQKAVSKNLFQRVELGWAVIYEARSHKAKISSFWEKSQLDGWNTRRGMLNVISYYLMFTLVPSSTAVASASNFTVFYNTFGVYFTVSCQPSKNPALFSWIFQIPVQTSDDCSKILHIALH